MLYVGILYGQPVTLTFTGQDANHHYLQLNRVVITNMTRNWSETLSWPDTVQQMQNGVGIDDWEPSRFRLEQNVPNPFFGTTDVKLQTVERERTSLQIFDMAGNLVDYYEGVLDKGTHRFRISLAAAQTYFLKAKAGVCEAGLKMVNNGGGGANRIKYVGEDICYTLHPDASDKGNRDNPFAYGDTMEYVGFADAYGTESESNHITQAQYSSEAFVLQFAVELETPNVATAAVGQVTSGAAVCGGEVISDGGTTMTARGVCWSTLPNPTVSDNHTIDGSGTGVFTSNMTGLTASTTYYVRAYATNSIGTSYGAQEIFTTPLSNNSLNSMSSSDTVFLPDGRDCGSGCTYVSSVTFNSYSPADVIQSAEDILYVRLNIEHSSIGDLWIRLTCPNQQHATILKKYGVGSSSSCSNQIPASEWGWAYGEGGETGVAHFGEPVDDAGTECDSMPIGTCWNYCWSNATNQGYVYSNDYYIYSGVTSMQSIDSTNVAQMSNVYHPDDDFSNLIGCPMNGIWSIEVVDGWSLDNGFLCGWEIALNPLPTVCPPCPEVTTDTISNTTTTTATCGGNVTTDGGDAVTNRGVCWSTSPNPTIFDGHTIDGSGTGSFTSNLTGLTSGKLYYVRAYATNSFGTIYGNQVSFTTLGPPLVETSPVINIAATSATCGGNVTFNCGAEVTARGVCWDTWQNPTVSNNHTTDSSGMGIFSSSITGLVSGVPYHVRAYATNGYGTSYGEDVIFTTTPEVVTYSVSQITAKTAICGGIVISAGNAEVTARGVCWDTLPNPTVSNRHTTDSSGIGEFTSNITGLIPGTLYYVRAYATNVGGTSYGNEESFNAMDTTPTVYTHSVSSITDTSATCGGFVSTDGGAEVTVRGVCWSTSQDPTVNDNHTEDGSGTGNFTSYITGLVSGITYYVRAYATNSEGTTYGYEEIFTTTPSVAILSIGNITTSTVTCDGYVTSVGNVSVTARGVCWDTLPNPTVSNNHTTNGAGTGYFTSSITGLSPGMTYYVRAYATNIAGTSYSAEESFTTEDTTPTVTTLPISYISDISAVSGGIVTADGGATVTARGVCWSYLQNPTINDSHTEDGTGMGEFISNITGLLSGTTFYVRAYATNSEGTAYGEERAFIPYNCEDLTPMDYDNNSYATVRIGSQCWLKENLRTTHYADGTEIPAGTTSAYSVGYRYAPNNNEDSVATYGYLYNWAAVMHGAAASWANPSGVQGICPEDWHVPSDAEWTQLTNYVSSQSQYVCGSNSTYIAKALASTMGWDSNTYACTVGNDPSANNATGFSAMPAGCYETFNSYHNFGSNASFWTTTENGSTGAYYRDICSGFFTVDRFNDSKNIAYSVRCVHD